MFLILITALISLHTKRISTIIIFVIAAHLLFGTLQVISNSISGGILISAIASAVLGLALYAWKSWYVKKHIERNGIKKLSTCLVVLILIFFSINAFIINEGIKEGKKHLEQAKEYESQVKKDRFDKYEIIETVKAVEYKNISSSGHEYLRTCNASGYILKSKYPVTRFVGDIAFTNPITTHETILMYDECKSYSKSLGYGTWCWANGGFSIEFPKTNVGFPRQDLDCKSHEKLGIDCHC